MAHVAAAAAIAPTLYLRAQAPSPPLPASCHHQLLVQCITLLCCSISTNSHTMSSTMECLTSSQTTFGAASLRKKGNGCAFSH